MLFKPDSAVYRDEQMGKPLLSFAFHLTWSWQSRDCAV